MWGLKNKFMQQGIIKKWDQSKGWGFIEGDDGYDYFLNISNLRRGIKVNEGTRVKFDVTQTQRGEEAENVSLV
tara:strand:- start:353 stop:571 length:219 start_codon:yes stop_codon:yes gene_type:complete